MSFRVSDIAADGSLVIGDDRYSRVTRDNWLTFVKKRSRLLCMRLNLVKRRAYFTITADDALHTLPTNCVQMTRLQFTSTPSDVNTFGDLTEMFEDEFRASTSNCYPTGDPQRYFTDQGFFYLIPKPTTEVVLGGRIEYWGLPDTVSAQADFVPLPDTMQDILLQGCVVDAQRKMEKYPEADRLEAEWEANIDRLRNKVEDRSNDRRSKVRLSSQERGYGGQV